jgi:hypothetical protein
MFRYKYLIPVLLLVTVSLNCTKLDQQLNSTLTNTQTANALGASFVLQTAYNDLGSPFSDMGKIFALQEVVTDECLVPTRGGDWDDNGAWRALHQHTWSVDGVAQILSQFNELNKINFDATNVLTPTFKASAGQAAEARFIRALALYHLLDFWGQFPFRNAGDNLLNAPVVYRGDSAINFIITELTDILPQLSASNGKHQANPDAAKALLMKCYLNKGAFLNRANPTFADADMQKVITLGTEIMNSNKYKYDSSFFGNFDPTNSQSPEGIFAYPNTSGVATNNSGIDNRWWATLHYNQFTPRNPQAGWNGFSTVAEFYNSFGVVTPATRTPADTLLDRRIGGRFYPGVTDVSGVRPGLLIGQQYNEKGEAIKDRKGNPLAFDPNIAQGLKETGNNLEVTGIRVVKYVPDYSGNGANYAATSGNWVWILRYPDVVLMVAEAKMRAATPDNAGALALVNALRGSRSAAPLTSMILVNPNDVYAPATLLAERGREMYWEAVRRTDLIRFGVFTKAWAYKPASDPKYLLFPIPTQALAANPNLRQNPGY